MCFLINIQRQRDSMCHVKVNLAIIWNQNYVHVYIYQVLIIKFCVNHDFFNFVIDSDLLFFYLLLVLHIML